MAINMFNSNNQLPSKERQLTLDILYSSLKGRKLDKAFEEIVSVFENDPQVRLNQVYNLVYGVARRHFSISSYINTKIKKPLPEKANLIIEIAIYELAYNRSSKNYAVISDALKLADLLKLTKYKPVINAILRRFDDDIENSIKSISSQKQVPEHLFNEIKKTFKDKSSVVMDKFLNPSPLFLSINTILINKEDLLSILKEDDIEAEVITYNDYCAIKTSDSRIFETKEFKEGFFLIQDLSSQVAVDLLRPYSGMKMLDVCSAPGGKAISAAIKAKDMADITAIDISTSRLFKVHENIKRMKIKSIKVLMADFMEQEFDPESFDRILIDPPCSSLGVMGRHPDVIWKKTEQTIKDLSVIQLNILIRSMDLLKKGGRLVYSVCTFTQTETVDVINQALSVNMDFKKAGEFIYTIPNDLGMDGLFIAVLEKK